MLAEASFDPRNGWYRARLIDVGLQKLPEYWAFGYGLTTDPGWGPLIIGLPMTDIVNEYLRIMARYGVGGLAMFVTTLGVLLYGLYRTHRRATYPWARSCVWTVSASLLGVMAALWTVNLFGIMASLFYLVLGLAACLYPGRSKGLRPFGIPCEPRGPARSLYGRAPQRPDAPLHSVANRDRNTR